MSDSSSTKREIEKKEDELEKMKIRQSLAEHDIQRAEEDRKHAQKEADKCGDEIKSLEGNLRHLEEDLKRAEEDEKTKK